MSADFPVQQRGFPGGEGQRVLVGDEQQVPPVEDGSRVRNTWLIATSNPDANAPLALTASSNPLPYGRSMTTWEPVSVTSRDMVDPNPIWRSALSGLPSPAA